MELAGDGADFGVEQPLDQRVDVFIGRADRGAVGELVGDAIETAEELRFFSRSHNSGPRERVNPRFARGDVLRPKTMVDREAAV